MPQEIVVTLKQQQAGGVWPFVRNTFALIGFGTVVVGLAVLDSPNPQQKAVEMIEAGGEGWRDYRAGADALSKTYGQAPVVNPYDGLALDPLPDVPALPDNPTGNQESNDVDH